MRSLTFFYRLQSALDALAKTTEETVGPKRKNVKKHNRSASVAYEALAFEWSKKY